MMFGFILKEKHKSRLINLGKKELLVNNVLVLEIDKEVFY